MNIKEVLLKDRSKEYVTNVVNQIGNNKVLFEDLLDCLTSKDEVLQFRASWALSIFYDNGYSIVKDYAFNYMDVIENHDVKGVKRTILRIFQWIPIPENIQGRLTDYSFRVAANPKESIAVRAFSLQILYNMYLVYPELKNEIKLICNEMKINGSGGLKNRATKIDNFLQK
jgi:hypothetical protein